MTLRRSCPASPSSSIEIPIRLPFTGRNCSSANGRRGTAPGYTSASLRTRSSFSGSLRIQYTTSSVSPSPSISSVSNTIYRRKSRCSKGSSLGSGSSPAIAITCFLSSVSSPLCVFTSPFSSFTSASESKS